MPSADPERRADLPPGERLRATIEAFPGQPFAVVDGAHFDDVNVDFARERLFARSLFLDSADEDVQKAGPWLVRLDQAPGALDRVMALVGDKPAAVYWCCTAGEMALWRHLRSINMVRIPRWAAEGGDKPFYKANFFPYETVVFRHYDLRVLNALLPCLDDAQFRRIVGPADEVAFAVYGSWDIKRVVSDASWRPAPPGLLTMTSVQLIALTERRRQLTVGDSVAEYLQRTAPEMFGELNDERTRAFVSYSERTGRALGIGSEAGHCRWAYLLASSQGKVLDTPGAVAFITKPGQMPDRQVAAMMRRIIEHLRA